MALVGGDWSASRPCLFAPGETAPSGTHWIGGWVVPRAGLNFMEEDKFLSHSARSQPLYRLS
jgi:hypothetical protein